MRGQALFVVGLMLVGCGGGDEGAPPAKTAVNPAPISTVASAPTSTATASTESAPPPPAKPPMIEMQKKSVAAMISATNAHDAKAIAGLYDADVGFVLMLSKDGFRESKGRDAIEQTNAAIFAAYPDAKMAAERVVVSKNVVSLQWTFTGTHSGDMGPMKATNKPIGLRGVSLYWYDDDGEISKEKTFYDFGTTMAQEGVLKQKFRPIPALPSGDAPWIVDGGGDAEKKSADAASKMLDTFAKHDAKAFAAMVTDDAVDCELAQPEDAKGPKAIEKSHADWFKSFPDAKLNPESSFAAGDWVVTDGTFTGTQNGAMGPIKPTKKPVTAHYAQVARFKDGKLAEAYTYYATAELLEQLGALPKMDKEKAKGPEKKK